MFILHHVDACEEKQQIKIKYTNLHIAKHKRKKEKRKPHSAIK
jgi:hypothetical protein